MKEQCVVNWVYGTLAVACVVMALVLLRVNCRSRYWLSAFMGFLASYLGLILLDAQPFYISPRLYFLCLLIIFLPGPLLLGYIGHISTRRYVGAKDFLPCALPVLITLIAPELLGETSVFELATENDYKATNYVMLFSLISSMAGLQILAYIMTAIWLVIQLRKDWTSYQSKTLPRSWHNMLQMLVVILMVSVMQILSAFINTAGNAFSVGDAGFSLLVVYFIVQAYLTAIGQTKEEVILQPAQHTATIPRCGQAPDLQGRELKIRIKYIEQQVRSQQLYLRTELSLTDMAEQLGMTTHKLSEAINKGINQSFYDFINGLRVHHAANLMLSDRGKSITEIFYEAGFTSKSSFYSCFKKTFDCTPSEYRKREAA